MLQLQILDLNMRRAESARCKDNHHGYVKVSKVKVKEELRKMLKNSSQGSLVLLVCGLFIYSTPEITTKEKEISTHGNNQLLTTTV